MLSQLFGKNEAASSEETAQLMSELEDYRAIAQEINKARCILEINADGDITDINQNMLDVLGVTKSQVVGEQYSALLSDTAEQPDFWQDLEAGDVQQGNYQFTNRAGETVWLQGYYAPINNSNGRLKKVIAYLSDVTAAQNDFLALQNECSALEKSFGIVECQADGTINDCNDLFLAPLGYQKSELLGKNINSLLKPEDAQSRAYKALWENLAQGEPQGLQVRRMGKQGDEFWFQATYAPVLNKDGEIYKVLIYSVCITEEKNRNADYLGQLEAISKIQGVIEFDLEGNILAVNDNFVAVTGYTREEIVGNHHRMFASEELKNSAEYKAFWERLGRGEAEEGVYQRFGKGGKEIWLQASYNPIYDINGKPYKVVKYATDITAFKLKEADNSGQINALNKVLGVIEFDLKGNITRVNENFVKVTGYSEDEIVGKHHSMFVDADYKNSVEYKQFWENLGNGIADSGQYQRVGKGGKEIWLEATYNPIFDMNDQPFKVVKFATEITEQHQQAKMLEDAVAETQEVIEQAKAGDLLNRVPLEGKSGDIASLCDGVNALMDKMTEVLLSIREAGESINSAAGEISTGNNDLSQRTEQQASDLEQTASSMEELASTVKQNAENAKQANQLASAASGVAIKGGDVVGNVVTTMSDINDSAQKIEDIITVIDGIAFQTNILALNAAVEAARAGEQGRGFAVVAGEVRNLAQRSASAAKEIKELITDSVTKTAEGTRLVEDAGNTMEEVVSSVARVTDIMGEISAASSEQSTGIDQVNNAVTSMDETTQQNAALVEEAAAAAESLVDQAVSLMETVGEFKIQGVSQVERRAPNSPMRQPESTTVSENVQPEPVMAKTGTDDDEWEEF